jgi:DNA-binding FadR family transcriptional regulator
MAPRRRPSRRVQQVVDETLFWIIVGRYRPGDRLPSAAQVTTEHKIGQRLARQVQQELCRRGPVECRGVRGLHVSDQWPEPEGRQH